MSELKGHPLRRSILVDICTTLSVDGHQSWSQEEAQQGTLYAVAPQTFVVAYDSLAHDGPRVATTTLKLTPNSVSLVRVGDMHCRQTFAAGEWHASQYFYDGGSLVCRNYTQKLDVAIGPEGGLIDILYELWSGDTHLGYYSQEFFIELQDGELV